MGNYRQMCLDFQHGKSLHPCIVGLPSSAPCLDSPPLTLLGSIPCLGLLVTAPCIATQLFASYDQKGNLINTNANLGREHTKEPHRGWRHGYGCLGEPMTSTWDYQRICGLEIVVEICKGASSYPLPGTCTLTSLSKRNNHKEDKTRS